MSLENIYKKLVQLNSKEFNIKKKESGTIDKIHYINSSLDNNPVKESVERVQKDEAEVKKLKAKLNPHVNCYGDLIDTKIKLGAGEGVMRIYASIERGSNVIYSTIPEKIHPYFIITKEKIINFDYTMGPEYKIEYIAYDHTLKKLSSGKDDCVSHIDFLSKMGASNENVVGPNVVEKYTQDPNLKSSVLFDYDVNQAICYMPIANKGLQYIKYDIRHPKGVIYAKKFHILGNTVIAKDGYEAIPLNIRASIDERLGLGEDVLYIKGDGIYSHTYKLCSISTENYPIHLHGPYTYKEGYLLKITDFDSPAKECNGRTEMRNITKMNNISYGSDLYDNFISFVVIDDKIVKLNSIKGVTECECGVYEKNKNYYNVITNELIPNYNFTYEYDDSYKINTIEIRKYDKLKGYIWDYDGCTLDNGIVLSPHAINAGWHNYNNRGVTTVDIPTETYVTQDGAYDHFTHSKLTGRRGTFSVDLKEDSEYVHSLSLDESYYPSINSIKKSSGVSTDTDYSRLSILNGYNLAMYFNESIVFAKSSSKELTIITLSELAKETPTVTKTVTISEPISVFVNTINSFGNCLCIVTGSRNLIILDKNFNEIKKIPDIYGYESSHIIFIKENMIMGYDYCVNINTGKTQEIRPRLGFFIPNNNLALEHPDPYNSRYYPYSYSDIQYRLYDSFYSTHNEYGVGGVFCDYLIML